MEEHPTPITILCGFLGSGKTTMLNYLLSHANGRKIAIIVNELGEVGIDGSLVKHTTESMVELSNGCICCTLRGDLIEAIDDILHTNKPDAIIIESTGIGEPIPIAQALYVPPELLDLNRDIPNLIGKTYVDAIITVIDAANFLDIYQQSKELPNDEARRGVAQLLAEQIEGADIVAINKIDLVSERQCKVIQDFVENLNPRAEIYWTENSEIDEDNMFDRHLFNLERHEQSPIWIYELENTHTPETEDYDINSFLYTTEKRFNEERLIAFLEKGLPPQILRSKGWVAIESSNNAYLWNHAGKILSFKQVGEWTNPESAKNEIVFIGKDMDKNNIIEELNNALAK
jgi:G3E family GTPase